MEQGGQIPDVTEIKEQWPWKENWVKIEQRNTIGIRQSEHGIDNNMILCLILPEVTSARPGPLPGRCSGWLYGPPQECVVRWAPARTQSRANQTER